MEVNSKAIILHDKKLCLWVKKRAAREMRSASNALAVTLQEAIKGKKNESKDT